MPGPWLSWTRTLSCKSDTKDVVYDPQRLPQPSSNKIQPSPSSFQAKLQQQHHTSSGGKSSSSSCNCSNLKDVVHGNTRVVHRASSSGSPRESKDDYLQEVSQDALFLDSPSCTAEAPLRGAVAPPSSSGHGSVVSSSSKKKFGGSCNGCNVALDSMVSYNKESSMNAISLLTRNCNYPQLTCQKCGDCFSRVDALEQHHIVQHAVSELSRGDSSRNIVEIIFRSSWMSNNSSSCGRIERVLKVHNSQRTLSRFEDYRDMVKYRANCMPKKNARCIADGNELLRFYGTTVACPLGAHGSTSLCSLPQCSICRIIRCGFPVKEKVGKGICTTATSSNAHNQVHDDYCYYSSGNRRVMLVCRVIAGRSYRASGGAALGEFSAAPSGFDSIVGSSDSGGGGNCSSSSDGADLVVFNPRAMLPCFVVIYKC